MSSLCPSVLKSIATGKYFIPLWLLLHTGHSCLQSYKYNSYKTKQLYTLCSDDLSRLTGSHPVDGRDSVSQVVEVGREVFACELKNIKKNIQKNIKIKPSQMEV